MNAKLLLRSSNKVRMAQVARYGSPINRWQYV